MTNEIVEHTVQKSLCHRSSKWQPQFYSEVLQFLCGKENYERIVATALAWSSRGQPVWLGVVVPHTNDISPLRQTKIIISSSMGTIQL